MHRNGESTFIFMALARQIHRMSWEISCQNLVKNSPVSEAYFKSFESFLLKGLQRNGGSKFISMALANVNPQNELADIISEPSAKLHSFKVITKIVSGIFA